MNDVLLLETLIVTSLVTWTNSEEETILRGREKDGEGGRGKNEKGGGEGGGS